MGSPKHKHVGAQTAAFASTLGSRDWTIRDPADALTRASHVLGLGELVPTLRWRATWKHLEMVIASYRGDSNGYS